MHTKATKNRCKKVIFYPFYNKEGKTEFMKTFRLVNYSFSWNERSETEEKTWKDHQKKLRKTLRRKAPRPHSSERLPGDSAEGRCLQKKRHGNRLPQDCNSAIIPLY